MIAVIADDFTGAAELGGIGLRYGLRVVISTAVHATDADLLIIAADTRSTNEQAAVIEMERLTKDLAALKPAMIYKKTDSVLRGHIVAELDTQLKALGLPRALLAAANPALGRTINNGTYFLHGQPIHTTGFATDPEFAIASSDVRDMLRADGKTITTKKPADALPDKGIIVGEVKNEEDLISWSTRVDKLTLPAGGSGFFTALLDRLQIKKERSAQAYEDKPGVPALFVCGTSFHKSQEMVKSIASAGGPVSYMPEAIATEEQLTAIHYEHWCNEIVSTLRAQQKALIAISPSYGGQYPVPALYLRQRMARVVEMVLEQVSVHELFIEGGSTAYAVLQNTGYTDFSPVEELAPGVIRMRVLQKPGLHITVKPGSYDWPFEAWNFGSR